MSQTIIAEVTELTADELITIAQAMRKSTLMTQITYDPKESVFMVAMFDGDNGLNFDRRGLGVHAKLPVAHQMAMNQLDMTGGTR